MTSGYCHVPLILTIVYLDHTKKKKRKIPSMKGYMSYLLEHTSDKYISILVLNSLSSKGVAISYFPKKNEKVKAE